MKIAIGLVGEIGAGKETFTGIFRRLVGTENSVYHLRTNRILKESCDLWKLPLTRENLQNRAICKLSFQ